MNNLLTNYSKSIRWFHEIFQIILDFPFIVRWKKPLKARGGRIIGSPLLARTICQVDLLVSNRSISKMWWKYINCKNLYHNRESIIPFFTSFSNVRSKENQKFREIMYVHSEFHQSLIFLSLVKMQTIKFARKRQPGLRREIEKIICCHRSFFQDDWP